MRFHLCDYHEGYDEGYALLTADLAAERAEVERLRAERAFLPDSETMRRLRAAVAAERAEVERLRAEHAFVERLVSGQLRSRMDELEAELRTEWAEVERLRQWKAEATTVLAQWEDVVEQIMQEMDPKDTLGRPKTDIVADHIATITAELAAERAEVERLTQLHERIAASDDVAKAYQQVYFEDFPIVKQAVADTVLAKEQLAAERAEVERLRAAGDALAEVVDDWPELVIAWREARHEQ